MGKGQKQKINNREKEKHIIEAVKVNRSQVTKLEDFGGINQK